MLDLDSGRDSGNMNESIGEVRGEVTVRESRVRRCGLNGCPPLSFSAGSDERRRWFARKSLVGEVGREAPEVVRAVMLSEVRFLIRSKAATLE